MVRPITVWVTVIFGIVGCSAGNVSVAYSQTVPVSYPDQPACWVKSVQEYPTTYESLAKSPTSDLFVANQQDAKGIYQVYTAPAGGNNLTCISCTARLGAPRIDRNKMMVTWHPSGEWLVVGVEEDTHDLMWLPVSWQRGLMQSGLWLNMWITTPTGDRWYRITNFKPANGPSNGFTGTPFTPDGKKAVWAEIVDGNVFLNAFGLWKLYAADFNVASDGTPSLASKMDITPTGARWVEPGNFAPDGRHLLISTDISLTDAEGQDQWSLDINTGALQNLTNTPAVWDEHGLYSPRGKKISFMSSYPYKKDASSYKTSTLRTEFMLMDSDGSHLQQLTHFNVWGYPEFQWGWTVAAVASFLGDGSQLFGTVMGPDFTKTNWVITFQGPCGAE
jgi:hypothetical protein